MGPEIRTRRLNNGNGLDMHVLEAGNAGSPTLLLLHGFPELAYSWRKAMIPLAEAGYHVVAPDQRGYGPTASAPATYGDDLAPYRFLNLVKDLVGLRSALGIEVLCGRDRPRLWFDRGLFLRPGPARHLPSSGPDERPRCQHPQPRGPARCS